MSKQLVLLSIIIFLTFGFCFVAKADSTNLVGYLYSESAGWISLNCSNTNSCDSIAYNVSEDDNGRLSGYGYSQDGQWINFNPNYGGANIGPDGLLAGWIFAENTGWARIDGAEIVSLNDLQNNIVLAENTVNSGSLSADDAMSLLNNLCGKFMASSECD